MNRILVVGIDSVVGTNLVRTWSTRNHVMGVTTAKPIELENVQVVKQSAFTSSNVKQILNDFQPDRVVYCGMGSHSSWNFEDDPEQYSEYHLQEELDAVTLWSQELALSPRRLTYISSDAIFTGPWMFHEEESDSYCDTPHAALLRKLESIILESSETALVVRTNSYGWSAAEDGWIEQLLDRLEQCTYPVVDSVRHATPILATDLAKILSSAHREELRGVYHIAGAERVSPLRFVQHLASQFDVRLPFTLEITPLTERPAGFGKGECSLQTRKIRKRLCLPMPMLVEGLTRLRQEQQSDSTEQILEYQEPEILYPAA